jgi:hypothetical protein
VSRYWQPLKTQGVVTSYRRKASPHQRTAAWDEARALRLLRRSKVEKQPRDGGGFIPKKDENGHVTMYDPGEIDRFLWSETADNSADS